jgi:hypothetical protein
VGGVNPATIAEFTLQRQATDFYDVTIINGVNIAEQMAPIPTPTQSPPANFINPATYWCMAPGSSCNWNLGPYIAAVPIAPTPMPTPAAALMPRPNAEMQQRLGGDLAALDPDAAASATTDYTTWLLLTLLPCSTLNTPSGCPTNFTCSGARGGCFKTCTTDSDCAGTNQPHCVAGGGPTTSTTPKYCQCQAESECGSSKFCGPQFIPGLGQFLQTCGAFGGWWSVDDFCGNANNVVGPFNCNHPITDGNGTTNTNLASLLGCTQNGSHGGDNSASCYNSAAINKPTCCGCATDSANPLANLWPAAPSDACYDNNTTWAAQVQPLLANLKQACPTAYSYPFDDVTSTFQCQAQGSVNLLGYKIIFADLVPPPTPAPTP